LNSPTICLVMICKDESAVIARALESAKPVIDCYCIVDTGSTDGTQEIIRETMRGARGELHERPWVDFGHNRTESLELARDRADYLLVLDADDILEMERPNELTEPAYNLEICYGDLRYRRTQLVKASLDWRYVGVLHEYIHNDNSDELSPVPLSNARIHVTRDGNRSRDPRKYYTDAALMEEALKAEPDNDRYVFYLAQSYRDSGQIEKAIEAYQHRVGMGGWAEEIWYSLYQLGDLYGRQKNWVYGVSAYLAAYENRPARAEPLYKIGKHYNSINEFHLARFFLERACQIPYPVDDSLFIESAAYRYLVRLELAVCLHYLGEYEQAAGINQDLIEGGMLPIDLQGLVSQNREFDVARLQSS
jgi:glycosyltransferase involved in cell wall biosynthesis